MIARKVGPALAAGCTMVCKPATATPYSALAMADLAARAGVPAGVFSVVTGSSGAIGSEMTSNPIVRKLTFTGSTEVGKILTEQCAATMKKVSMELGGNAPFIVFDDADLDSAVEGAMASKYRNAGQTCVCANRMLVQDGVYDEFAAKLSQAVSGLLVGNGMDTGVNQGPLIDIEAVEKVEAHIADAVSKGARVVIGGERHEKGGTFFQPTVLANVDTSMAVTREETFGPVAPIITFKDGDDILAMANDTHYGLAAYVYTQNLSAAMRTFEGLNFGIVGINDVNPTAAAVPFGGMKESGLGREGGFDGLKEYLETKVGGFSV